MVVVGGLRLMAMMAIDMFATVPRLNIMDNDLFLKELKFGVGDGYLQYYLYNWKTPKLTPSQIGLVLL